MARRVHLIDSTLREGLQSVGFCTSLDERIGILRRLDRIGCAMIELGHPGMSPVAFRDVCRMMEPPPHTPTLVHGLIRREDVDLARQAGVDWIGFFLCIRPELQAVKYGTTYPEIYRRIADVIDYAHACGIRVRFSCEDASRTEWTALCELYRHLLEWGVDLIGYSDTTGCLMPQQVRQMVAALQNEFPDTPLFFHAHNDRGVALANALEAIRGGCTHIDASVLGLGERMGIVPLTELALILNEQCGQALKVQECHALEQNVWSCVEPTTFIMRRFAHKAGLHGLAMNEAESYESIPPEVLGGETVPVLSAFCGRQAIRQIAVRLGVPLTDAQVAQLADELKGSSNEWVGSTQIRNYLQEKIRN